MRARRPSGDDAGFTLVELVVTLTIVALVGSLFALAAFQSITITADASSSLADSAARSTLTTRLRTDVQTAVRLGRDGGPCAAPKDTTQVLWTAVSDGNDGASVSYYVRDGGADRPQQLLRRACDSGDAIGDTLLAQWPGTSAVRLTCDASSTTCGSRSPLAAKLDKGTARLVLSEPDAFPETGPAYRIRIDDELATVVAGFGTDTLTLRAAAADDHAKATTVSYVPATVTLEVPDGDAARFGTDVPFTLTVSRRTS